MTEQFMIEHRGNYYQVRVIPYVNPNDRRREVSSVCIITIEPGIEVAVGCNYDELRLRQLIRSCNTNQPNKLGHDLRATLNRAGR